MGFPSGSDGKESACNARDLGLISGSGRSPGNGNGNPLQYSRLENSMLRGAWQTSTWGLRESDTTEQLMHTHSTADHPTWKPAEFSKTRAWSINVILEWPEILNVLLWTWSIFTFSSSLNISLNGRHPFIFHVGAFHKNLLNMNTTLKL